jgi:hypothetical protein
MTQLSRGAQLAPAAPIGAAADLLAARQTTHGDFAETAAVAQTLKAAMRDRAASLPRAQREALDMIATKLARILCGDANHADHWLDLAGYARLAAASPPPDNSVT